ncbi:MAG: hypothetical protein M5U12_14355 [Verrucomicrobia bacterium]|nr:hypothetical protein [Verrucomicrobiota bacterium]
MSSLLRQHGQQLRKWLREELTGLRAAFHAQADPLRAAWEPPMAASAGDTAPARSLESDLALLQHWPGS